METNKYPDIKDLIIENNILKERIKNLESFSTDIADIVLGEKEKRFKELFRMAPIGISTVRIEGNIINANPYFCNMLGYNEGELKNMTVKDISFEEDYKKEMDLINNISCLKSNSIKLEKRYITKNGKTAWANLVFIIFQGKDNNKYGLGFIENITEKKLIELNLNESKRQLSTLIGNLPGIAYSCQNDNLWTMDFISDAVYDITGYPVESLINNNVISYSDLIYPEDREKVKLLITSAINKKYKFDLKYRITTALGDTKWVLEQGCAIFNRDGSISHIEGYISDITDTIKREDELIKAKEKAEESDKLKSTFLATMSHELRTPLNGIIGFSELMDKTTPPEQVEVYSRNILDCGNSLLAIIEDIFDLALLETNTLTLNRQTFKIFEIYLLNKNFIEELLRKSGKENDIKLIFKPDNEIIDCFIESDKFKINQVLANLIKNAVKFTNKGTIEFGFYSKEDSILTFYIKDSGIGIPKESQEIIFEFFRQAEDLNTRSFGGTGIGLTISRMIANALDGSLTLESEQGKGSTFYFSFPFTYSSDILIKRKENKLQKTNTTDFSGIKILIVEDEEINLFLLESILDQYNPQIIKAENGLDAIVKYHEHPDIKLILMDIKMPIMDGISATSRIREFNKEIPIIALTAYNYEKEINNIKDSGFNTYISKPFNKEHLVNTIKEQLDLSSQKNRG